MKSATCNRISPLLLIAAALSNHGSTSVAGFAVAPTGTAGSISFVAGKRKRLAISSLATRSSKLYSASCTIHSDDPMNNRHSASDWLYNIKSFPQSKVLQEIRNPVLAVAGWSFVVSLVYRIGMSSWASPSLRYLARHMCIPGTAHSFLVSALGLLLVFRTNSAYQRFNVS